MRRSGNLFRQGIKMSSVARPSVQGPTEVRALVDKYSRYSPSPLSLRQFLDFAQNTGDESSSFLWLRKELPTRLANMMKEMNRLPSSLLGMPSTSMVTQWYQTSFMEMMEYQSATVSSDNIDNFTRTLEGVIHRHRNVVETMAHGIIEWKEDLMASQTDDPLNGDTRTKIQYFLDRFYTSRIGIRLLINQHILLFGDSPIRQPNLYGSIDPNCDVGATVDDAYHTAKFLCEQYYLGSPDIKMEISNACSPHSKEASIIYAPSHLHHICFELFKNAMRATMERHSDSVEVPKVRVIVTKGDSDCCIRISDQGGGAARQTTCNWFQYLYSTAPRPPRSDQVHAAPLAGYGYGLPIARLYARYLGGDLEIQSLEGYGTDAFIYLRSLSSEAIETVPVFNSATSEHYSRSMVTGDWVIPSISNGKTMHNSFTKQ